MMLSDLLPCGHLLDFTVNQARIYDSKDIPVVPYAPHPVCLLIRGRELHRTVWFPDTTVLVLGEKTQ